MYRLVIFGNAGSGKSTLARSKAQTHSCIHLDLDSVAWAPGHDTPTRNSIATSRKLIAALLADNENWVIEGCYADLLALVTPFSSEIVFLNPGTAICMENCRRRPWEPHKYESVEAQNANLERLIAWVKQYEIRTDEFSLRAHRRLFDEYEGTKREYQSNAGNL